MRVYTNVRATFARPRKNCPMCFISHLPAKCPGERVLAPVAKCGNCFITHLPTACTGVPVEKRLAKACASCFVTHTPAEHKPFTRVPYVSPEEAIKQIEALARQQQMAENFEKFKELQKRPREKPLTRFGFCREPPLRAKSSHDGLVKKVPPLKPAELWAQSFTLMGLRGQELTYTLSPGVLCRVSELDLTDSLGGTSTEVKQIYVGNRSQIDSPYAGARTDVLMLAIKNGRQVMLGGGALANALDACQVGIYITVQVKFLESCTFAGLLTGKCIR